MKKNIWLFLLGVGLIGTALVISSANPVVREGDTVTLNFNLVRDDGTVYASSKGREPLKVTLGKGQLNPSFEEKLIGLRLGESKTFTLSPEEAYGAYRPELVGTVDRNFLPEGVEPEIGKQLQAELKDGTQAMAVITSFTDTTVTVDANHPLAGQSLTFDIQLMAIEKNAAPAAFNQTTRNWLILAVGVAIVVFVFFNIGQRRYPNITRKNSHAKLKQHTHSV